MRSKILLVLVLSLLICASRPVEISLFGMANNIAYVVLVDDSTFVQIAVSNKQRFYFLADADSGTMIQVISGFDTAITDVPRVDDASDVVVYPNPTSRFTTVNRKGNARRFEIFTVAGQFVVSYEIEAGTTTIALPPLASGVYFWRCGSSTGKLTILH